MFLKELSDEAKRSFLDLALICAKSDGVFDDKEKEILEVYCLEMGLENPKTTHKADYLVELFTEDRDKLDDELDEIFSCIDRSREKNIVYFELCSMIFADESISEVERYILESLKAEFYYKEEFLRILEASSRALLTQMEVLKDIENLVKGEN